MAGTWIETLTGKKFDYMNITPEAIDIVDIAGALSMIPRFLGHTRDFFSVAQHCVHVSQMVEPQYALEALLHDAPEAYLGDMPTPLKRLPAMAGYRDLERRIWEAVVAKWGLPEDGLSTPVHKADWEAFRWEFYAIKCDGGFHSPLPEWAQYGLAGVPASVDVTMECWSSGVAHHRFLERFNRLLSERTARESSTVDSPGGGGTGILAAVPGVRHQTP